jgi:hypothetical protein
LYLLQRAIDLNSSTFQSLFHCGHVGRLCRVRLARGRSGVGHPAYPSDVGYRRTTARTGRPEPAFWVSLQVLGGGQSTVGGYRFRSDEKPHQEIPLGLNRILIYTCEMQEPVVV